VDDELHAVAFAAPRDGLDGVDPNAPLHRLFLDVVQIHVGQEQDTFLLHAKPIDLDNHT